MENTETVSEAIAAKSARISTEVDNASDQAADNVAIHLRPSREVATALSAVDWSFTDADTRGPGHDIHPYPAKFIPQIPAGFIERLSQPGETVLDPFGGSGTTALEAVRLGRKAISLDANPLSALIGRVKTARLEADAERALQVHRAALTAHLNGDDLEPTLLMAKYARYAVTIANREKWFADTAYGELCLIRSRIDELEEGGIRDIALIAMSRMVIRASFQDSETRYKSVPRQVPTGETLKRYLREFDSVVLSVSRNEASTRYGISRFICGDIRTLDQQALPDGAADLVVTSPPYGNATDYHLYHRFRLLWLGFDPIALGRIEIGSHLKHQRQKSGFESYLTDMEASLATIHRALKPGRYAVLVIGDSVYEGATHNPAEAIRDRADQLGFEPCAIIDRPIHSVKRSFAHAGRRATSEHILVLRRKSVPNLVEFTPPPYRLWKYEADLRLRELGLQPGEADASKVIQLSVTGNDPSSYKRVVFSHSVKIGSCPAEPTWQAVLENGGAASPAARKDPKYVTHGIHPYKGKFYPQLAKGLLNLAGLQPGAIVLDPFCGSGTTLLEGYLNGYNTYGCDMNPLAAKIARAKVATLDLNPDAVREIVNAVLESVENPPTRFPALLDQISEDCREELLRWFAAPVAFKLNWIIKLIRRTSAGVTLDFLEVILSSIVREVSNQDPNDLRIRFRVDQSPDADVLGLFAIRLREQFGRIEKFWKIRGNAPQPFLHTHVVEGDNRDGATFVRLGLASDSVDVIVTSPPYGTALPYIDTDRLSLLLLMGMSSSQRRPVEAGLIGSREIGPPERRRLEEPSEWASLPIGSRRFLKKMLSAVAVDADAGFRKRNAPALMARYLKDMAATIEHGRQLLRPGGEIMMVIGDNSTTLNGSKMRIPCTDLVEEIAFNAGFEPIERINISVTTENLKHIKNAILENVVLRMRRPN